MVAPGPREGYYASLAGFARQGYDLVVAFGNLEAPAVARVARRYPGTRFVILDVPHAAVPGRPSNVEGIVFREQEAGFLVGYLAGLVERRGGGRRVVSSVGGYPIAPVVRFVAGFRAGLKAVDPHIVELNAYAGSFNDPTLCAAVAASQLAAGSRAIFAVAGGCGAGALEEAKAHGAWGIGVDSGPVGARLVDPDECGQAVRCRGV